MGDYNLLSQENIDDPTAIASTVTWGLLHNTGNTNKYLHSYNAIDNGSTVQYYNLQSKYENFLGTSGLSPSTYQDNYVNTIIENTIGQIYGIVTGKYPGKQSNSYDYDSIYNRYLDRSKTLMDLNEAVNSSQYVKTVKNKESSDLDYLTNNVVNEKYRKILMYRTKHYKTHLYNFFSQIVIDILLMSSLIFIVIALHLNKQVGTKTPFLPYNTTLGVSLIIAVLWTIVLVMRIRFNLSTRRPYNWDRHYWSAVRDSVNDCYII